MIRLFVCAVVIGALSAPAAAQIPPASVYLKSHMDSLRKMGWPKGDTARPDLATVPGLRIYGRPRSFEEINGYQRLVNVTARGKVYSLLPDHMPVLSPDMYTTEAMPGSSRTYRPAPPSKMP
ncbi:MAG: hypothetical protein JST39_16255, partial [Bacteroidetes bacterium]|nr:hypothetical protein [Bacteroidota bacterium]